MSIRLSTASFTTYRPDHGVPVRISRGYPMFRLRYPLTLKAPTLCPSLALFRAYLPDADWEARYRAELTATGHAAIEDELLALSYEAGDDRLVLLCFERLPAECHRRQFAHWWQEATGDAVPEVGQPEGAVLMDGLDITPATFADSATDVLRALRAVQADETLSVVDRLQAMTAQQAIWRLLDDLCPPMLVAQVLADVA